MFTRFSGNCLLWPWRLTSWPQSLIRTSINPNTSVTKIGWSSLHWFWDMVFTSFSGHIDSLTHSHTDGQTRIQNVSGNVFNSGRGIMTNNSPFTRHWKWLDVLTRNNFKVNNLSQIFRIVLAFHLLFKPKKKLVANYVSVMNLSIFFYWLVYFESPCESMNKTTSDITQLPVHTDYEQPKVDRAVAVCVWSHDRIASMIWKLDVSETNSSIAYTFNSVSVCKSLMQSLHTGDNARIICSFRYQM